MSKVTGSSFLPGITEPKKLSAIANRVFELLKMLQKRKVLDFSVQCLYQANVTKFGATDRVFKLEFGENEGKDVPEDVFVRCGENNYKITTVRASYSSGIGSKIRTILLRAFSVILLLYLYSSFLAYTNIWVPENECTGVG